MFSSEKTRDACSRAENTACSEMRGSRAVSLFLVLICLFACAHRVPQSAFDQAERTLQHGDITDAAKKAEEGYRDFHSVNTEWAWRFAILRARILHWQGRDDEVLVLLATEPRPPSSGELAVKKRRLEGAAYISLHRFAEAERKLAEAERLCSVAIYTSCIDVVSSRGILEMERGDYAEAQILFERVLASARVSGDKFLEANTLLDLSWSADEQTHFDEAVDWANAARQLAIPLGFADVAQTALGNMGWAYYRLGNP